MISVIKGQPVRTPCRTTSSPGTFRLRPNMVKGSEDEVACRIKFTVKGHPVERHILSGQVWEYSPWKFGSASPGQFHQVFFDRKWTKMEQDFQR